MSTKPKHNALRIDRSVISLDYEHDFAKPFLFFFISVDYGTAVQ